MQCLKVVGQMIGCYVTGAFPKPKELIEVTRAYDRKRVTDDVLEKAFQEATVQVIEMQISSGLSYVTDGMLKWNDLLRPFAENLEGLKVGSLARWFNNNTFYRKPIVEGVIRHSGNVFEKTMYPEFLPQKVPWKAILPAPYTFAKLSENKFYRTETELMFAIAEALNREIKVLAGKGFKYVQLSDPALVYNPLNKPVRKDVLADVEEALKIALKGVKVRTCLQTFFGDFSQILPEALDFPVDDLGVDFYESNLERVREYRFDKGVALGVVDARSVLVEDVGELFHAVCELVEQVYPSKNWNVFVCPNCDLEFLPWTRVEEKMRVLGILAEHLRSELSSFE